MDHGLPELPAAFRLRPTRAAKVSEISEATSTSAVPPEDRVNFHIGNPVQEQRLTSAYVRAALGLDVRDPAQGDDASQALLEALEWPEEDRHLVDLVGDLVRQSGPYLPRGGFARATPSAPVLAFLDWLERQSEPLSYDLGKSSGRREIILASGGVVETLRVFLHALSEHLVQRPARVFLWHRELPPHMHSFDGVVCEDLPTNEPNALATLRQHADQHPEAPTFLILGSTVSEEMRRSLRAISLTSALFFVEANDAPNHLSLAREAKLVDRVIRLLTPGILRSGWRNLSLVFVAGNADYLSLIETMHFQLKGTPSASEATLLAYLIDRPATAEDRPTVQPFVVEPPTEASGFHPPAERAIRSIARHAESLGERLIDAAGQRAGKLLERAAERMEDRPLAASLQRFMGRDPAGLASDPRSLLQRVLGSTADDAVISALEAGFCSSFVRHHPSYDSASCVVVSGSSRTALSLLGFHGGLREAIIPDLSWTYEHCFPQVHAVPLTSSYGLDVDGITRAVAARLEHDPSWADRGAVVLNNPHNATGRVFEARDVRRLLSWLLDRNVWVIDDLSYDGVAPSEDLTEIMTLREHANDLVATGAISSDQSARVITVHSISKTDSMAGARLCVVEIRHRGLRSRLRDLTDSIVPNVGALMLSTLFYRNSLDVTRAYWRLRNRLLADRMSALHEALQQLPADRNPFAIEILPPDGSLYPLMFINRLPAGLSLDWIAAGLARQGIGMVPLTTFARTEEGFETGRKAFRLTLGGTDGASVLRTKVRRVLIDLNRLIAEEEAKYRKRTFAVKATPPPPPALVDRWEETAAQITQRIAPALRLLPASVHAERSGSRQHALLTEYVPERLASFRQRAYDRESVVRAAMDRARSEQGRGLLRALDQELVKDDLNRREGAFQRRLFDRTVHPTQMYSLRAETSLNAIVSLLLSGRPISPREIDAAAEALVREFHGFDVAISSGDEAQEVLLDLDAQITAEMYGELHSASMPVPMLSFWGDWDGSNRPSGQGHRLVASVLIENVRRMAVLLERLRARDQTVRIDPDLRTELEQLPGNIRRFFALLNEITTLTHHLERRYRGVLPVQYTAGRARKLAMQWHLLRDPVTTLWHHNDRLERRMLGLRRRRVEALEYYFGLNKRLRKALHQWISVLGRHLSDEPLLREAAAYRDLLKRFVLTPRVHQSMVVAQDPFAVDTTVFNINEINEVGARYGNPGMVLALQISMTTKADALISLDRKMRARREHILRDHADAVLPPVRLVPLFEDRSAVQGLGPYLDKVWEYALQSRRMDQSTRERFTEVMSEVFIAGSDLSQQIGQTPGEHLYREAKLQLLQWLSQRGIADAVRMKMGSGEPMQRQGGYYSEVSGSPAFLRSEEAGRRFRTHLRASARTSAIYATTPMLGIHAGGDLRTLQSAVAERIRYLSAHDHAQLLYHLTEAQRRHHRDHVRAAEEIGESRLRGSRRGEQALERLTVGMRDAALGQFLPILTENFRQILYGREDDVVGIHLISYFIARTTPPLRDRPTVRPSQGGKEQGSRILERIAATIPFSRYGSLLRAIAHNQAQTVVLGVNQLTTGLFRALDEFARHPSIEGDAPTFIADRILPHLPVYEILQSLRWYHDPGQTFLKRLERALPAGNSALAAQREDVDAMAKYLPLFRQELLRRHGVDVSEFFDGPRFIPQLLPTVRPDLAVVLQADLFNTDPESMRTVIGGAVDGRWMKEVERLLSVPAEIRRWRERAWSLLERPVYQRVESFVELAVLLHALSQKGDAAKVFSGPREIRLSSGLANFFRTARTDDDMQQFLVAAVEYLSAASEGMAEVPANIIKAMKEVERIARIEEQALDQAGQDRLRLYLLSIARLTGENG
ncbi:MAG: pyridoxal phosphate-dependent aminotransferase [Bacteroidetes bacterium]|jgi:aspartate/methionine/tyrosine aminotransferase|nr:pyridoxal phosphate-dependent aminotransferase [Bacteroidota bacterium]